MSENLGIPTEEAVLAALSQSKDGEMKAIPLTKQIVNVLGLLHAERRRGADIAMAIDSGRGNEKEIALAILQPTAVL